MSEKVYVTARFKAKADKVVEMIQVIQELSLNTQSESGCVDYGYYQSTDDPHLFTSFETWADPQSEQAHWETEHLKKALAQLPDLLDGEPEITKYTKVS